MNTTLPSGLYDRVVTEGLADALKKLVAVQAAQEQIPVEEGQFYYSRYVADIVRVVLRDLKSEEAQREIVNRIIDILAAEISAAAGTEDRATGEVLLALVGRQEAGLGQIEAPMRPGIPLSRSELLVNARGEYRIGRELETEIHSADRIDVLCSFIKWSGLRLMLDTLKAFAQQGKSIRVITTVYMGATERRALDALVDIGADVRISHDARRTRLHAKAWMFHRKSGYSTAYIGSSNLSAAAQLDGLEWNVRVSSVDAEQIVHKFALTFDSYWDDVEFVHYTATDEERTVLDTALGAQETAPGSDTMALLELRPYPFQQEILERLDVERSIHGRTRNLVVAATGTGKTVIAALDFRRLWDERGPLKLLFVAHRREILTQSLQVFRHAMADPDFGELYVGGERPVRGNHVFGSVQTLSRVDLSEIDPAAFDVVIVDEFHHAEAPTYQALLEHFRPAILLGLTATPERADGKSIMHWFDDRMASELRLWDAIDRGLLAPFQYFGVHDGMDLTRLKWKRGGYDLGDLEGLYTGNDVRLHNVVLALTKRVEDVRSMRALGFCVSVAHAEYMAKGFSDRGIPAVALTGNSPREERRQSLGRLRRREVNVVFTVDLFNEGVDIAELDTLLLLRPTQSPTIFIQQLGRGLRMHHEKTCLTVLDFIGLVHKEFRYDKTLGALLSSSRDELRRQIEEDFPLLPSGCSMQLDRKSKKEVLNNIRRAVRVGRGMLSGVVRRLGPDAGLQQVLAEAGVDVKDFYRRDRSLTELRRAAGFTHAEEGDYEAVVARSLGRMVHVDDADRQQYFSEFATSSRVVTGESEERRRRLMLLSMVFGRNTATDPEKYHRRLLSHAALCSELQELMDLLRTRVSHKPQPWQSSLRIPLFIHCTYRLQEVMAAFHAVGKSGLKLPREGVVYDQRSRCNLLFVTLRKSEKLYSPTTMYDDYAVSSTLFHWQSQGRTRADSSRGRRHIEHEQLGITPLLFARHSKSDAHGTVPYLFLGPLKYVTHEGDRPMNIMWRVRTPIPADFLRLARVAA